MGEVQAVEERLAALEQKIDSFAAEHSEFRSVHVSRRGAEGRRGETGSVGPVGPPADPNQVAEIAAELVKKYFKHEDQVVKFERLLKDLEGQIDSSLITVKAALRWAVIEELKTSGA